MPFKLSAGGKVDFIRLPLQKSVYGVEKGDEGKRYLYLRRFDTSGLDTSSVQSFAKSGLNALFGSSFEDDWIIPIKTMSDLSYPLLRPYQSISGVKKLLDISADSRPWLKIIKTPNDVLYLAKRRISASSVLQGMGLAVSMANPVTAVAATGWFVRKQWAKYKFSQGRGETHPSLAPKVFVYKTWQISVSGNLAEAYKSIAYLLGEGSVWTDLS
jgi:hypothetical protein